MWDLINKLPKDILKSNIIPLTYNIQSSDLLLDIQNFNKTKIIISNIYYIKNEHLLKYEKNADKYWLVSDILFFIKINKSAIYKDLSKIYHKYMSSNKCIHYMFNLFWGLLNPFERDYFITIRNK